VDDLVARFRQITQWPTKVLAAPTDAFLLQEIGLGGPFVVTTAFGIVQGAFLDPSINWNVLGDFSIGGDLGVGGNTTIGGLLEVVQGISTDGDITTNNGNILATIGNLEIGGAAHIGGNLLVGSINNQGTLTNAGDALFQGNAQVNGWLAGVVWVGTSPPPVTIGGPSVLWWQQPNNELMLWDGNVWQDLAGRHLEMERWDDPGLYWDDPGWEWW